MLGGTEVTVTGSGFGSTQLSVNTVTLNDNVADITSWTDTQIIVTLPANPPGSYPLRIKTADGYAR